MSTFIIYVLDSKSDTYKNLHITPTNEQDARNTAVGSDAIVFKDGEPWKYFDNHGASYVIAQE
jgi:hypothetical protein